MARRWPGRAGDAPTRLQAMRRRGRSAAADRPPGGSPGRQELVTAALRLVTVSVCFGVLAGAPLRTFFAAS